MSIEKHKAFIDSLEGEKELPEICDACGGDGKETCNNPDHGLGMYLNDHDGGNHGCPICRHDPNHKVPNGGSCDTCKGTGKIPAKGLPEEMNGWRFDAPLFDASGNVRPMILHSFANDPFTLYLIERCHRAESCQIPDLKEKVKELVRDAMDIAEKVAYNHDDYRIYEAFRALCATEVKP